MLAVSSYLTHTVTVPELLWTVATGLGLILNIGLLRNAYRDLLALRRSKINSIREYAAISNLISETLRSLVQFAFFLLGLGAMFSPNPREHVSNYAWVLTITFVVLAAVITGSSFLDKVRRKRLMELILNHEDY